MKEGMQPFFVPHPSALIPSSRRFVDRLVLVAHAEGRAESRADSGADRDPDREGSAAEVVGARDEVTTAGRTRAAADASADERAAQTVPAAGDLHAADAVALERDLAAVVREIDGGVGRRFEAAGQAVAVLGADDDLLAD